MLAKSPKGAVDRYIDRLATTFSLVARVVVVGRGVAPGRSFAVLFVAHGGQAGHPATVLTHGGDGELLLRLDMRHRIENVGRAGRGFTARTIAYDNTILDRDGREIVAFHWEPDGIGTVRTPHVHLSVAAPSSSLSVPARRWCRRRPTSAGSIRRPVRSSSRTWLTC